MKTLTMTPPRDFTPSEVALYHALKASGDNHSVAVLTVMGERLYRKLLSKP